MIHTLLFPDEIMAKSKVPIGTTEDLTFTMEDAPECVFSLAITVINPLVIISSLPVLIADVYVTLF